MVITDALDRHWRVEPHIRGESDQGMPLSVALWLSTQATLVPEDSHIYDCTLGKIIDRKPPTKYVQPFVRRIHETISPDSGHIDYTYGNCGVRVCSNICQVIARDDENSIWEPRENAETIPVAKSVLSLRVVQWTPINALALAVARYEDKERDPELRQVLRGLLSFSEALSGSGSA